MPDLYIITLAHAQYLGMAPSVAGGWVATSASARDAVAQCVGDGLLLARLPCPPSTGEGRPVQPSELAAIVAHLERSAAPLPPWASCLESERRQAVRSLALITS